MEYKKKFIEAALTQGLIQIQVNTKIPGVQLPEFLMARDNAILNLSRKFSSYMELKDTGVYASLSFFGKAENVEIPWKAIWLMKLASGIPMMFSEDAPLDNLPESILRPPTPLPKLTLEKIEGGGELTPPRKGHLKLLN